MTGYLDTSLDVEDGERIAVFQSGDRARMELLLSPDAYGFRDTASTYLTGIQCRALAALLLITVEEIERWGEK